MNKYATVYSSMLNKLAAGEAGIGGLALGATSPARRGASIPKWENPAKTQAPFIPRTRMPQQLRVGGTLGSIVGKVSQGQPTPTAAPDPSTIQGATGAARAGAAIGGPATGAAARIPKGILGGAIGVPIGRAAARAVATGRFPMRRGTTGAGISAAQRAFDGQF